MLLVGVILLAACQPVSAQPPQQPPTPTLSLGYTYFPYRAFSEPPQAELGATEVQPRDFEVSVTYPLLFDRGRTAIVNQFSYELLDFQYRDWPQSFEDSPVDQFHAISWTIFVRRVLSEKWSMLAIASPGLASDLDADKLTIDQFTFQAAVIFMRPYGRHWMLGYGAAYSTAFGVPLPLPAFTFNWTNGRNMRARGILPVDLELFYIVSPKAEIGVTFAISGNDYHGDPRNVDPADFDTDKTRFEDVEWRYSRITVGPAARFQLSRLVHLDVDAGWVLSHQMDLYDGGDEVASYSLETGPSVKAKLTLGAGLF
jgi:hypothetical protein